MFSPIFRLHSTTNLYLERRPWGHDAETFRITQAAMRLRHSFIPYLYSMAWQNHRQDIPAIRPMYHIAPDYEQAYACPNQYTYGSELIGAPFITPRNPDTNLNRQVVWLPKGDWYGFFDGRYYSGDKYHAIYGGLDDIPLFARAGAIVPLGSDVDWGGIENPEQLTLHIFPGADNHFELFEDNGDTTAYLGGGYAITPLNLQWKDNQIGILSMGAHAFLLRRFIFEMDQQHAPSSERIAQVPAAESAFLLRAWTVSGVCGIKP